MFTTFKLDFQTGTEDRIKKSRQPHLYGEKARIELQMIHTFKNGAKNGS